MAVARLRQRTVQVTPGHLGLASRAAVLRSAMGGTVLFEDALAGRLDLMRPSRATVAAFLAAHPPRLTRGPWPGLGLCSCCEAAPKQVHDVVPLL